MVTTLTRSDSADQAGARARRWTGVAGITVGTIAAVLATSALVRRYYIDPFTAAGQYLPLAVAVAVAVAIAAVDRIRGPRAAAATGVVLVPTWVAFFAASQIAGTPYDYGGMHADIARLSALATRFTVSTASSDQLIHGLPSEYPPLFPWLVGKAAVVTGVPAWRLLSAASVVTVAVAPAAAYALWRRVAGPVLSLALCLVPLAAYGDPRKAYEVLAASVLFPWIIATVGRRRDGGTALHWLPAGVVGGLMIATYQAYLAFVAMGVVVLVAVGLSRRPRWPYARHLLLTAATSVVVAAWYLVPWLSGKIRHGGASLDDKFHGRPIAEDPWHFLWAQAVPVTLLLIAGLVVLVWYARSEVWARCLLAMALSAMVYRWLNLWRNEVTGHTGFLVKTGRVSDAALILGLVWGMARAAPAARRWLAARSAPRALPVVRAGVVATVLIAAMATYWQAQRLDAPRRPVVPNFARLAQATQLPDGGFPRYASHVRPRRVLPMVRIRQVVESMYGRNALPVTLSYSEAISSYYPYYQYVGLGQNSSNSLSHWPERWAEVRDLSRVADPVEFARRSAHLRYGAVDVFVLQRHGGTLHWGKRLTFVQRQFADSSFVHVSVSPTIEVFLRRGAVVDHANFPD